MPTMRNTNSEIRGLTLIELLVVIAVIGILAVLLFGALKGAQNKANQAKTTSNLRNIGVATFSFAAENGGQLPSSKLRGQSFSDATSGSFSQRAGGYPLDLMPYMGAPDKRNWTPFFSPMDKNKKTAPDLNNDNVSYFWRHCVDVWSHRENVSWAGPNPGQFLRTLDFGFPSRQILVHERTDWHGANVGFQVESPVLRKAMALFADGSVRLHSFGPEYGRWCDPNWFPFRGDDPAMRGFNLTSNYDVK